MMAMLCVSNKNEYLLHKIISNYQNYDGHAMCQLHNITSPHF